MIPSKDEKLPVVDVIVFHNVDLWASKSQNVLLQINQMKAYGEHYIWLIKHSFDR